LISVSSWLFAAALAIENAEATAVILAFEERSDDLMIVPCGTVFPEQGDRFERAHAEWRAANAEAIALGKRYIREELSEPGEVDEPLTPEEENPGSFIEILRALPRADALAWCERTFGLPPAGSE
jgi:hypothetical protein